MVEPVNNFGEQAPESQETETLSVYRSSPIRMEANKISKCRAQAILERNALFSFYHKENLINVSIWQYGGKWNKLKKQ